MQNLASCGARALTPRRPAVLLACAGGVWMWPGVALTEKRGARCVPIAADIALFWITRLHGPEANDSAILRCFDLAAGGLNAGDEPGAQKALDSSRLIRLSTDGAALMRAVADRFGIAAVSAPRANGPRLWRPVDIEAHVALFEDHAPVAQALAKAGAWDEEKHPRWPAGSDDSQGGRFQGAGGAGSSRKPIALPAIDVTPAPSVEPRGIGDNGGPPLEEPPKIPEEEPLTQRLRNVFVKGAAKWLARAVSGAAFGPAGEFLAALAAAGETAKWLFDKYPFIKSYVDEPKSLDELQADVATPKKGYEVHHIVEQGAAVRQGHSRDDIDAPDNLVRIPTLRHWEITGWYMTPDEEFDNMTPREYLRGKDWQEHRRVGLRALSHAGVLKP